jgi:phospholipid/cholesterol/gamma-HCH transport system substrate-binding protein
VIRRGVLYQLAAFALIAVLGVIYAGFSLVGIDVLANPIKARAQFSESGGIFPNAEVTYRGKQVGYVADLELIPGGVEVVMEIEEGTQIPLDTTATVANRSPIGEQYVDLTPRSSSGPFLASGDVIPMSETRTPVPIQTLLGTLNTFATSVPLDDLRTTIRELGLAFDGLGPELGRLIDEGNELSATMEEALPETRNLLEQGNVVLRTQADNDANLQSFSRDLADFAQRFAEADPDFRRLLSSGVEASEELNLLLQPNQETLTLLLGNLISANSIVLERIPSLRQQFIAVAPDAPVPPGYERGGFTPDTGNTDGRDGGGTGGPEPPTRLTPNGRTFADLEPIREYVVTEEREFEVGPRPGGDRGIPTSDATQARQGLLLTEANEACEYIPPEQYSDPRGPLVRPDGTPDTYVKPFDQRRSTSDPRCSPSGESQKRGAVNAPVPYERTRAMGGGSLNDPSRQTRGRVGTYDPATGIVTAPNGERTVRGWHGGEAEALGKDSWNLLLLSMLPR